MKCLKEVRPGPRIDTYLLRERSYQSSEAQWQDTTHSPPSISTPVAEEVSLSATHWNLEPNQMQLAMEKNIQGYRPQVKWPKSSSKKEWTTVNTDLSKILNELRGTAEKKLDKMCDLIYSYGMERFSVKERGKKEAKTIPPKSRRQQEIMLLVKERRNPLQKRELP